MKLRSKIPTIRIKRTLMFKLHWRVGLIAAFFIIWLSVTGILLNHSRSLGLHENYTENPVILSVYNMSIPDGYIKDIIKQEGQVIVQTQDDTLTLSEGDNVEQAVARSYRGEGVNMEKIILDLHTGKLFGLPGTLISDLAALALLFLTFSGLYNLWRRKKG